MDRVAFFGSAGSTVAAGNFSDNAEGCAPQPRQAPNEVKDDKEKQT